MLQIGGDFALEDVERAHIEAVVSRCRTKEEAAQVLRIDDSTLYRKRKRFETPEH